ncbi:unnamed protein product [Schistocephalus solidus]|uniref:Ig-like domain-containing protein n=1 Tax=Schistocephalus solidus TaxID=70667 RepID=A0A183TLG1_SCHSO|nr:unnamed protein product [Schistocephalus solidus]
MIAFGKENTVLKFSCITSPYFGNVTIKWLKKMAGFSTPLNPTKLQRTFNVDNAKRQISDSNLDVVMPSHDQVGFLICEAWADNRVVAEKAIRLDILCDEILHSVEKGAVGLESSVVMQASVPLLHLTLHVCRLRGHHRFEMTEDGLGAVLGICRQQGRGFTYAKD